MQPARARRCGTPGCLLPDYHDGLCQPLLVTAKRERLPVLAPAPAKAPRRVIPKRAPKQPIEPQPLKVAEQGIMSSSMHKFYHVHRWGLPLPDGPVECDACSDDEVDESWRLDEMERRTRSRAEVSPNEARLARLWNEHLESSDPIVSDRMLTSTCHEFARIPPASRLRKSVKALHSKLLSRAAV